MSIRSKLCALVIAVSLGGSGLLLAPAAGAAPAATPRSARTSTVAPRRAQQTGSHRLHPDCGGCGLTD